MYYNLSQIQWLNGKLLALGKKTPGTGNRQFTQNNERGHIDFIAALDTTTCPQKETPVSITPPTAPSGVI